MFEDTIRIGTLASAGNAASFIRQTLPHGFESYSITFWQTMGGVNIKKLAKEVNEVLEGTDAVISSVAMFGNPLCDTALDKETRAGWRKLIDNAHLFNCDIVGGFAGRIRGESIDKSMAAYKKVFGPLAKRAADKGVRLAFENCDMGGTWNTGDHNIAHNPTAWEMMFNEVPMDNVGLEWEPCHQMVSLIDPMPQLRKYAKKIFHVHGKDATVMWDVVRECGVHGPKQFAFHRTPGFGDSNWTDIISELRMNGFVGSIDIEGNHDPVYNGKLEMTGQVRGLNYLKDCRGGSYVANPE